MYKARVQAHVRLQTNNYNYGVYVCRKGRILANNLGNEPTELRGCCEDRMCVHRTLGRFWVNNGGGKQGASTLDRCGDCATCTECRGSI